MRKCLVPLLTLALVAALAAPAAAQETTGGLRGAVSFQGEPLPGVAVALASPARGLRFAAVTDNQGSYRFPALPVGSYTLSATLDKFQTYKQTITITVGATPTLNFEMVMGSLEEAIVVTGTPPLVDTSSTTVGLTVNAGELNSMAPILREATQIALLAPASISGDSAFDGQDAASTSVYTPGQSLVSMGGSSVAENSYLVNGLNITNFRKGLGGSFVPFEFIQEVQVKTGGYEAEFGRSTGGVINMVTKSGSNDYHGDLNVYYQPESLQEASPNTHLAFQEEETYEELQPNLSVGGRIFSDKLFFYAFLAYTDRTTRQMETTRGTTSALEEPYYGGKVDWYITSTQRIEQERSNSMQQ